MADILDWNEKIVRRYGDEAKSLRIARDHLLRGVQERRRRALATQQSGLRFYLEERYRFLQDEGIGYLVD